MAELVKQNAPQPHITYTAGENGFRVVWGSDRSDPIAIEKALNLLRCIQSRSWNPPIWRRNDGR